MVWYDIVVLVLLVYTAWSGAQRGLVTQLAWIAALVLCFKFADKLAPVIEPQINVEQPLRHWIAMFVLYLGFSLGSFLVARILHSWMEQAKFKDFDRHLGGLFGLIKGAVIVLVVTFFAVTLSDTLKAAVLQSNTGKAACYILDSVEPITPEYFHEYLVKYQEELAGIHHNHDELGPDSSSFSDFIGGGGQASGNGTGEQGGGLNLPNLWTGLTGGSQATEPNPAYSPDPANPPSFDEMWRRLPGQLQEQMGQQIRDQWNSSTPEQKQNLVNNLGRSFQAEIPEVVSDFLGAVRPASSSQGGAGTVDFNKMLNEIGTIYQDRTVITQRTMEYLAGVPSAVQQAVIQDWHADLTLEASDPDPLTDVNTKLDERILRQLDRAGVSWNRLSLELRQRLNQSRQ